MVEAASGDNLSEGFMAAEYQDLYENIMHIENELFSHLSFYTGLFTGTLAASVAIFGLMQNSESTLSQPVMVAILSPLFFFLFAVGRLELRMTTELRVRKMKFVEGCNPDPPVLC